ncbi:hypothetical protein PCCS19_12770 [Paenibacillus sp. CCS19]|nr:hypothetical protein PCCS19_12770 [Paenibacillus cellulosilyticus]
MSNNKIDSCQQWVVYDGTKNEKGLEWYENGCQNNLFSVVSKPLFRTEKAAQHRQFLHLVKAARMKAFYENYACRFVRQSGKMRFGANDYR